MAEKTPQTYENHRRLIPLYHGVVFPIFTFNLGYSIWRLAKWPHLESVVAVLVAAALVLVFFYAPNLRAHHPGPGDPARGEAATARALARRPQAADRGARAGSARRPALRERRRAPGARAQGARREDHRSRRDQEADQDLAAGLPAGVTACRLAPVARAAPASSRRDPGGREQAADPAGHHREQRADQPAPRARPPARRAAARP